MTGKGAFTAETINLTIWNISYAEHAKTLHLIILCKIRNTKDTKDGYSAHAGLVNADFYEY